MDHTRSGSVRGMETDPRELMEGDVFMLDGAEWAVGPQGYNVDGDYIETPCYKLDADGNEDGSLEIKRLFGEHGVDVIRNKGALEVESSAGPVDVPPNAT